MQPLQQMSNPPIDREQVQTLFGPLAEVMAHHELFYTAFTTRTRDWSPKQTIGSVFMTVSAAGLFHYMLIEALVNINQYFPWLSGFFNSSLLLSSVLPQGGD